MSTLTIYLARLIGLSAVLLAAAFWYAETH